MVVKNNKFKHFTLLGTKLYFQTNSAKKLTTNVINIDIFIYMYVVGWGGGVVWARICLKSLSPLRLTWSSHENNKGIKGNNLLLQCNPHLWPLFFIAIVSHFFGMFLFFIFSISFDGVTC